MGPRGKGSDREDALGVFPAGDPHGNLYVYRGAEFIAPIFHISYDAALYLFVAIVAAYVIAGGIKGVMLTDALQGTIMLVGMVGLLIFTYAKLGGITAAHQALTGLADRVPPALAAIGHQGWTSMPVFGWARPGTAPAEAARYSLWWTMVSTIVLGVGIGVLAQPQLIVRFMTVKSRQALSRGVAAGGVFIFFMTGVAFVVGALANAYFVQQEEIVCRVIEERALLDPGADGQGVLALVPPGAPADVVARAKPFVAYQLPGHRAEQPLLYLMRTPATQVTRGTEGAFDRIRPGMIAIGRTVTLGTTLRGNSDTLFPRYINSALPKWFGVLFLMTLLSAAMSTLSSQFHTMGTAIGRDIFAPATRVHARHAVQVTRLGIVVGLVAALILGKMVRGNIIALATAIFFGVCASAFLPAFVGGLFWRRMTRPAALASIVAGLAAYLFWTVCINAKTAVGLGLCQGVFGRPSLLSASFSPTWAVVDPLLVALPVSAAVALVVSLLTRRLPREHVDYVFGGDRKAAASVQPAQPV